MYGYIPVEEDGQSPLYQKVSSRTRLTEDQFKYAIREDLLNAQRTLFVGINQTSLEQILQLRNISIELIDNMKLLMDMTWDISDYAESVQGINILLAETQFALSQVEEFKIEREFAYKASQSIQETKRLEAKQKKFDKFREQVVNFVIAATATARPFLLQTAPRNRLRAVCGLRRRAISGVKL